MNPPRCRRLREDGMPRQCVVFQYEGVPRCDGGLPGVLLLGSKVETPSKKLQHWTGSCYIAKWSLCEIRWLPRRRGGFFTIHSGGARHAPAEIRSVEKNMTDSKTELLGEDMKKRYRSCVMRAAYLAQDNQARSAAVKTLSRRTRPPTGQGQFSISYPDGSSPVHQAGNVRQGSCVRGHRQCKLCIDEVQLHRSANSVGSTLCGTPK